MRKENEIRREIDHLVESNSHVLQAGMATIDINAPKALMQLSVKSKLEGLYFALGEQRPKFKCDDINKVNT